MDVDPAYKTRLMLLLTKAKPYPNLSRQKAVRVLVTIPSVIVRSISLKEAVLLEMLIELAGGSVDIRPAQ